MKWFYTIVEIKLGLQYEPDNIDLKSVFLSNWIF